jgi:peptidoglycan-associated lipoprotein
MRHRWMVAVCAVAILVTGCAKKPAMTATAAPPPTGQSGSKSPQAFVPASQRNGSGTSGTQNTGREKPSDYAAVADLKDIHFDFDKYDIRPGDAKLLDANAAWLKNNTNRLLLIEGHCDERGTNEYNIALGDRRAKATMSYLVAQGVASSRITLVSYGEERPMCTEHNEACWAKNRRAHFLVKAAE